MVIGPAHSGVTERRPHRGGPRVRGPWAILVLAATASAVVPLYAQPAQGVRVVPLVRDDKVLVSYELRAGFTSDVRAAIDSGLKTTFTYMVDLRLDVPGWLDRTIATAVVTNSVEYDNLQRTHTIERRVDGRLFENTPFETEDASKVREWLTTLTREPLFSTRLLQPNREYYVRVSATARPSYGSILWPFGSGTSGQKKFTFIP